MLIPTSAAARGYHVQSSVVMKGALARLGVRAFPLGLTYELTWLCNLECHYCDRHTPLNAEMTTEQIFRALDEFHAMGMRDISLDGGEALTHPDVDQIVTWLVEKR